MQYCLCVRGMYCFQWLFPKFPSLRQCSITTRVCSALYDPSQTSQLGNQSQSVGWPNQMAVYSTQPWSNERFPTGSPTRKVILLSNTLISWIHVTLHSRHSRPRSLLYLGRSCLRALINVFFRSHNCASVGVQALPGVCVRKGQLIFYFFCCVNRGLPRVELFVWLVLERRLSDCFDLRHYDFATFVISHEAK